MADTLARQTADVYLIQDALARAYKSPANPAREKERLGDLWIQETEPSGQPKDKAFVKSLPRDESVEQQVAVRRYIPTKKLLKVVQTQNCVPLYRPKKD